MPGQDVVDESAVVAELPRSPLAPGSARATVQLFCKRQGLGADSIDLLALLTSELVTNAVIHGHSAPVLRIDVRDRRIRIEVEDDDQATPAVHQADNDEPSGRGLMIVSTLATSWGVETVGAGKTVWFEIEVPDMQRTDEQERNMNAIGNAETIVDLDRAALSDATENEVDLTKVAGDGPAAVLLVDLRTRAIVFANPVAEQLAPSTALPVSLDEWSDAAELRDLEGMELSESTHPLSVLTRVQSVAGQAVSAARQTELGRRREPLWVVALPLTGAMQFDDHAIVVFLPLAHRESAEAAVTAAQAQADLRHRAVLATGMSFTMADARANDMPLIWVNPAFTSTTGYSFDEAVGANCRFLQGEATDPSAHVAMRKALDAGEAINITLLNYRKDGTAFWNQVSMSPIHDSQGTLTHYVGIQTDVTGRVIADQERDRALAAEKLARREAERAQRQLSLLAEATSQLAATLDVRESLARLGSLVVPLLADWVVIATADRAGELNEISAHHRDGRVDELALYTQHLKAASSERSVLRQMLRGAPARFINDFTSDEQRRERSSWVTDADVLNKADEFGVKSVLFAPLPGRGRVDGVMVLVRGEGSPPYTEQDLAVACDLGRRAGLTLDNARLYQSEHRIAETLQRSLLPDLPEIPNVQAAARYRAGAVDAAVGGDFYELIALRKGAVGLAIGDVVGHDVMAAAAMGHLRGLLRACAWDGPLGGSDGHVAQDPATVLERVDELIRGLRITTMASVAYACIEPAPNNQWNMRYSSAGHPPMIVRAPDGSAAFVDGDPGVMLGVQSSNHESRQFALTQGSTIIAYTDGLIERRDEPIDIGMRRLLDAVASAPMDPSTLCDHLLAACGEAESDDVAVLAVRF